MRVEVLPVIVALGEWQTCAAINRFLGTQLLPPDLDRWTDDDRRMVLALADLDAQTRK
jgi:hypothetical protein